MVVTVQVEPATARALHSNDSTGAAGELLAIGRQYGFRLEPMHPGSAHPELQSFFIADIADPEKAEELSEKLRQHQAVLAAYIKPAEGLP